MGSCGLKYSSLIAQESTEEIPAIARNRTSCLAQYPDFETYLPEWAYNDDVAKLAKSEEFGNEAVPMGVTVGPAVKLARLSAAIGWGSLPIFTAIAAKTSTCESNGFVYYPVQLWLFYVPIIIIKQVLQYYSIRYVTIPFVQIAGPFKVMQTCDWGFLVWFILTMIISTGSIADYATDSFFLAVVLRTNQCDGARLEQVWDKVVQQSLFPEYMGTIPFTWLVWSSYLLMVTQPIFGFLNSTPACCEPSVDYQVGSKDAVGEKDLRIEFRTAVDKCYGTVQNMGDALFAIAEVCDMVCVQALSTQYPREKAKLVLEGPDNEVNKADRIIRFNRNSLQRCFARIGLVQLLESSYQANLQVTVFGMFRYINDRSPTKHAQLAHLQLQTMASVILGVWMGLVRTNEVWQVTNFSIETYRKFNAPESKEVWNHADVDPATRQRIMSGLRDVMISAIAIVGVTLLYLSLLAYALMKLIASFYCEDHLWNITGCVDMDASE